MKKSHVVLLLLTVLTVLLSIYSLNVINRVYRIDFAWYSEHSGAFSSEKRLTSMDAWQLRKYPEKMVLEIIGGKEDAAAIKEPGLIPGEIRKTAFDRYLLLYCSLGRVFSPDFRIKVTDIAQRGSTVEVKVSLNGPVEGAVSGEASGGGYVPVDIVRIDKSSFSNTGKLQFIFKNQDGNKLFEKSYLVR